MGPSWERTGTKGLQCSLTKHFRSSLSLVRTDGCRRPPPLLKAGAPQGGVCAGLEGNFIGSAAPFLDQNYLSQCLPDEYAAQIEL
jgi:hypothetical protein